MSNEQRVLALIEQGNPVPDPAAIETLPAQPAEYLATLQQRSSEVTQLDERTERQEGNRRPWRVAAVAAALVIIAGVLALLLNQNSEEAPTITEPTPTTVAPAPTIDPTGYWNADSARRIHISEDGTYAWMVVSSVRDRGVWEIEDDTIRLIASGESELCNNGDIATVRVALADTDTLELSTISDDCADRGIFVNDESRILERTDPFEVPPPPTPEELAWRALPLLNAPGGGLARLPNFLPELAFESNFTLVPGVGDDPDFFEPLFLTTEADVDAAIYFFREDNTSLQAQRDRFENPEGFDVSETEQVEVDGVAGLRLRLTVILPSSMGNPSEFPLQPGTEYVFYLFDSGGAVVLVIGDLSEIGVDQFDTLAMSIVWRDLLN